MCMTQPLIKFFSFVLCLTRESFLWEVSKADFTDQRKQSKNKKYIGNTVYRSILVIMGQYLNICGIGGVDPAAWSAPNICKQSFTIFHLPEMLLIYLQDFNYWTDIHSIVYSNVPYFPKTTVLIALIKFSFLSPFNSSIIRW